MPADTSEVSAAGGVLERDAVDGPEIALVHRTRYLHVDGSAGDWVLPKGKIEDGESVQEAALREVAEETGCSARIVGAAITVEYPVDGKPKAVSYFPMVIVAAGGVVDASEIASVCWLSAARAVARLTYANEREIVARYHPLGDETAGR